MNTISDAYKDFTLVLSSATKTFNIAGTKNSFTIIENEDLRKAFKQKQLANNQHEIPTIGLINHPSSSHLRETLVRGIENCL